MSTRAIDPRIERTHALVVGAAIDLLADEGFERTTIDAIAERSGVARSTIYRHWPDRADLFVEVFARVCGKPEPDLDTGPVIERLRAKAHGLATGLNEESWGRMLPSLVGAAPHDDDMRRALVAFNEARRDDAYAVIAAAADRGELDADQDLLGALEQFISPFFMRHLLTGLPIDGEFVERQLSTLATTLGLAYESPQGGADA